MVSLAGLHDIVLAHASGMLLGLSGLSIVLALIAIALWRKQKRTHNALLLLIEQIDRAIGTKSPGMHEAAAALEEYVDLSGKLVAQLRDRNYGALKPSATQSNGSDEKGTSELNRAIGLVGELMALVPHARALDWAEFRSVVKLDGELAATRSNLERLQSQPLRNDVIDEAVRGGVFDLPLSLSPLLQRFFPDLQNDGIGKVALDTEKAVRDLLASAGISIQCVDPLEQVDAADPHIDRDGNRRELRRVPTIRSRVATASEAASENQKALVIDCHQPGFWRGDHALRPMKIAVFSRAEWAVPLSARQEA